MTEEIFLETYLQDYFKQREATPVLELIFKELRTFRAICTTIKLSENTQNLLFLPLLSIVNSVFTLVDSLKKSTTNPEMSSSPVAAPILDQLQTTLREKEIKIAYLEGQLLENHKSLDKMERLLATFVKNNSISTEIAACQAKLSYANCVDELALLGRQLLENHKSLDKMERSLATFVINKSISTEMAACQGKSSYASCVDELASLESVTESALIIRPLDSSSIGETSTETRAFFEQSVKPHLQGLNTSCVQKFLKGGIGLECPDSLKIEKIKAFIENCNNAKQYEIFLAKKLPPQLIIYDVHNECSTEELLEKLKAQNFLLQCDFTAKIDFYIIAKENRKHVVLTINEYTLCALGPSPKISLDNEVLNAGQFISISCCKKCGNFGHTKKFCKKFSEEL